MTSISQNATTYEATLSDNNIVVANLTPHDIVLFDSSDQPEHIPAFQKGGGARLNSSRSSLSFGVIKPGVAGVTWLSDFGGVQVLDPPKFTGVQWPDAFDPTVIDAIIVSMPVAQHLAQETAAGNHPGFMVLAPNTGPDPKSGAVRDSNGQIIGTRSLELYVKVLKP